MDKSDWIGVGIVCFFILCLSSCTAYCIGKLETNCQECKCGTHTPTASEKGQ